LKLKEKIMDLGELFLSSRRKLDQRVKNRLKNLRKMNYRD